MLEEEEIRITKCNAMNAFGSLMLLFCELCAGLQQHCSLQWPAQDEEDLSVGGQWTRAGAGLELSASDDCLPDHIKPPAPAPAPATTGTRYYDAEVLSFDSAALT